MTNIGLTNMTKTVSITFRTYEPIAKQIDELAAALNQTRSWVITEKLKELLTDQGKSDLPATTLEDKK